MARSKSHGGRQRRAREGAIVLEAVLAISALSMLFAWSLYMHRLGAAKLEAEYTARQQAWKQAFAGCGGGGLDLKRMVSSFRNDENTDSTGFLGLIQNVTADVTREASTSRPLAALEATLRGKVVLPCTMQQSDTDPISDPTGWVLDLFK